jgi:hypothetical protein
MTDALTALIGEERPSWIVNPVVEPTCTWTYDDSYENKHWECECGQAWWIMDDEGGGLAANEMNFCPKCGRRIVEVRPETEKVEDDE